MSSTANYASIVRNAMAQVSAANTNRDGSGTLVPFIMGGQNASRIERIQAQAAGASTPGMLRLFKTKGFPGALISALTASTTTVTVKTAVPHGRSNGEKVYMTDCFPQEYNVMGAVITVTAADTFTYQVPAAPTAAAASTLGYYLTTSAASPTYLWREIAVTGVASPSGTVPAWSIYAATVSDPGFFPAQLNCGWLLQAATNNAETFNLFADYGNY